jgi:hypothetical protein
VKAMHEKKIAVKMQKLPERFEERDFGLCGLSTEQISGQRS